MRGVDPADGEFVDAEMVFPRDVQEFGVKGKPVSPLARKQDLRALGGKALEPALGVDKGQAQEHLHELVECSPHVLPNVVLPDLNVGLGQ